MCAPEMISLFYVCYSMLTASDVLSHRYLNRCLVFGPEKSALLNIPVPSRLRFPLWRRVLGIPLKTRHQSPCYLPAFWVYPRIKPHPRNVFARIEHLY